VALRLSKLEKHRIRQKLRTAAGLSGFYQFFMRSLCKSASRGRSAAPDAHSGTVNNVENRAQNRFLSDLHCFFMSPLINFSQAMLPVYPALEHRHRELDPGAHFQAARGAAC